MELEDIGRHVYVVRDTIPAVSKGDIQGFLKDTARASRARKRFCTHKSTRNRLQEMFVAYGRYSYVQPNKHDRDESLHIVDGRADFVFFDNDGTVSSVVPLGDYGSGLAFYCRVPEGIYHTWIIHSDVLVVHETIPGPFFKHDTTYAPWAPPEEDHRAILYMTKLRELASRYSVL